MTSATGVGNTVKIATPTYDWEKVGTYVNEGPGKSVARSYTKARLFFSAGLYHGGRTFIVFSASGCNGDGYKVY